MNIEASGLQSFFAALSGADKAPDTWLQDAILPEQFAVALTEQIALLRQTQEKLPDTAEQIGVALLQELASFSGNNLPAVGEDIDIDLDATLQALAEVLKTIETTENASDELAEEVGEAIMPLLSPSMPVVSEPTKPLASVAETKAPFSESLPLSASGAREISKQADTPETPGALVTVPVNQDEVEVMPKQNDGGEISKETGLDVEERNQGEPLVGKKNIGDFQEQGLPKMATDIAQLNRAVVGEKTELAPMGRHFAHPQWGNEFSERLVWMHKRNIPSAELNLNPRHLGPISIRIDVNQEQTSIAFTAHHAVVKDAIEAAIPRLREMLGAQQLNLVNVDVSQQQSEHKQANEFVQRASGLRGNNGGESAEAGAASIVDEIEAGRAIASQGILSLFA